MKRARHSFPDKDGNSRCYPIAFTGGRRDERVTHVGRGDRDDGVRFVRFLPQKRSLATPAPRS